MKTFKASYTNNCTITEHEVTKETNRFITYIQKGYCGEYELKELKESSMLKHFSNYSDAKQWLMDQLDIQMRNSQARVDRLKSHNTSGVCGVSWSKQAGKWQAQIMSCRKYMHLGYFSNLFDAVCVRKSAEILHNFHVNHGKKLS